MSRFRLLLHLLLVATPLSLTACAPAVQPAAGPATQVATARSQAALGLPAEGIASWYGPGFAGNLTANGEIFNPSLLTAAHKTLPFDTWVRVTNLHNSRSVSVRINDRGPFTPGRIIDLSRAAAEQIGMIGSGTARVRVELLTEAGTPIWTASASDQLGSYEVVSRFHEQGDLLYLSSATATEPLMVRVVDNRIPTGVAADLLLSAHLYGLLGPQVYTAP